MASGHRCSWAGAASSAFAIIVTIVFVPARPPLASDHTDGPLVAFDRGSDICDAYFFLDPNDNAKAVLAFDTQGFIVPAENVNYGLFDSSLRYRFQIENTGDARGDAFIDVTFTTRNPTTLQQTASITLPSGSTFTALTTPPSATAASPPEMIVSSLPTAGISFFAGLVDDPFFFDLPAELLYRKSRIDGSPDPAVFNRGRDTFAGYNTLMIALEVPVALLRGSAGNDIGLSVMTQRTKKTVRNADGTLTSKGTFVNVDRMGIPLVNTIFIPPSRRDEYNAATTQDDANQRFVPDINATLAALHTDDESAAAFRALFALHGDILRLDTSVPNTGRDGGMNPEAAFPNGRRPADDVVDVIVTLINNRVGLGDNVPPLADRFYQDNFPFFALPNQPQASGVDDHTRN